MLAYFVAVDAYLEEMTVSGDNREKYVEHLLSDIAGLCGVQILARSVHAIACHMVTISCVLKTNIHLSWCGSSFAVKALCRPTL
jgi:hypothetical protein